MAAIALLVLLRGENNSPRRQHRWEMVKAAKFWLAQMDGYIFLRHFYTVPCRLARTSIRQRTSSQSSPNVGFSFVLVLYPSRISNILVPDCPLHFPVARSKSLFDDPAAEISELSHVITHVRPRAFPSRC